MHIRILGPLVAAAFAYILLGEIKYAYQAAFLFMVYQGLVSLTPTVVKLIRHKHSAKLAEGNGAWKKGKSVEVIFTFFALILMVVILLISNISYFSAHFSAYRLEKISKSIPQKTLITAMNQLKRHPNNMLYCAPMFFPSLEGNRPKAVARYLAYYHLGKTYCNQYWWWGRNNCTYLQEYNYGFNPSLGLKNIRLCKIASSADFQKRVKTGAAR